MTMIAPSPVILRDGALRGHAGCLSVDVPVKNEADNVSPLVERVHAAPEGGAEFEQTCVDDGSTDDTAKRLAQASRHCPPPPAPRPCADHRRPAGRAAT